MSVALGQVEQGPRTTPGNSNGGGVGIGINVDIGATIRALRNLNKKDKTPEETEVETAARAQYAENPSPQMTEEQFVTMQVLSFKQYAQQLRSPSIFRAAQPKPRSARAQQPSTCKANGSFEAPTLVDWTGADNGPSRNSSTFVVESGISTWSNTGISGGAIGLDTSHQTLVGVGNDPVVGAALQQVRPGGGSQSVRIGNNRKLWGGELLAKNFVVSPSESTIGFWYAAVLNDGNHGAGNPKFVVRVLDSTGSDISTGRVNLGAGSNVLIADTTNPFFQNTALSDVVFKDWTCVTIDLSDLVGQSVTVEFVTLDCHFGGHWSYAYVDDFCTTCGKGNTGWTEVDTTSSATCGVGKICFDVTAPKAGTSAGQSVITFNVIQNGTIVKTLTSPKLPGDGKYCFPVDPSTIAGLDLTKGFDYSAKTDYFFGTSNVGSQYVGNKVEGQVVGKNNDYQPICVGPPPTCGTATTPPCVTGGCGAAGQPACGCIPGMPGCIGVPRVVSDVCLNPPCADKPKQSVSEELKEPKTGCVRKAKPAPEAAAIPKPKPVVKPKPKPVVTEAPAAVTAAPQPAVATPKPKPRPVAKPKPKVDDDCE